MKRFSRAIAVLAALGMPCAGTGVPQVHKSKGSLSPESFLIDSTKPYVYLEVDHVGPRDPIEAGEPKEGIWLRLRNNCMVPITVGAFDVPPNGNDGEVGVYDRVVLNTYGKTFGGSGPSFPDSVTAADLAAALWSGKPLPATAPPTTAAVHKNNGAKASEMPHGYGGGDVGWDATVDPGKSIYFSIPRNQVSPDWHVDIFFKFVLKNTPQFSEPISYVALYEDEVAAKSGGSTSP